MNEEAAVAYDAWQEGRAGFPFAAFVDTALAAYAARYDIVGKLRVYATERCGGEEWGQHKMDVYCTFCRGLLIARVATATNPVYFPKVKQHTTGCALACLAGLREMAAPGTRGLIAEDRVLAP